MPSPPPPPPRPPAPPPSPSPPPPLLATTIAAARTAIAALAANEEVEIWLDEGSTHNVSTAICVHNVRVTLRSQGVGARIDGLGESRIFDVAHGGRLVVERVNLTNGGDVWNGAAISARGNSFVDVRHATISDSHAVQWRASPSGQTRYPSASPEGGAIAASLPAVAEIDRIFEWAYHGGGSHVDDVSAVAVSPDGSSVAIARNFVHILDVATGVMSTSTLQVGSHSQKLHVPRSVYWQDSVGPVWSTSELSVRPSLGDAVLKPLAWHPDGSKLAVIASGLRTFSVLDAGSLQTLSTSPDSGTDLRSIAWSPTGTTIATGYDQVSYDPVHGFTEPWLRIWEWDAQTPALTNVSTIHDPKDLNDLPADSLSCAHNNNTLWAATPVIRCGEVFALAFAPDGQTIFASSSDQRIRQINATNLTHALQTHAIDTSVAMSSNNLPDGGTGYYGATALALSADGQQLAYAGRLTIDNTAVLQRIQSSGGTSTGEHAIVVLNPNKMSEVVQTLDGGHTKRIKAVAFSPDGTKLASASSDQTVKLWSVASGTVLQTIDGHQLGICGDTGCEVNTLSWSPDGRRLFSGSLDSTVRSWDTSEVDGLGVQHVQRFEVELTQGMAQAYQVAWPPTADNILVWGRAHMTASSDPDWVKCISCPAGRTDCGGDGCLWGGGNASIGGTHGGGLFRVDAVTGAEVEHATTDDHSAGEGNGHRTILRCSDNGAFCAIADTHRANITIFDAQDLSTSARTIVEGPANYETTALAWSPSSARLATSLAGDFSIRIWDTASLTHPLLTGQGHNGAVTDLAYSPDGSLLASSSNNDRTVRVWNASDMSLLQTGTQPCYARAISWAPDGKRVRAPCRGHLPSSKAWPHWPHWPSTDVPSPHGGVDAPLVRRS